VGIVTLFGGRLLAASLAMVRAQLRLFRQNDDKINNIAKNDDRRERNENIL
jgi:hypothetical protein